MQDLPSDIQYCIIGLLPVAKLRLVATAGLMDREPGLDVRKKIAVAMQRVGLYTMIRYKTLNLFSHINEILVSHEYYLFNYQDQPLLLRGSCLIYGPVDQANRLCRFCRGSRAQHKYVKMMDVYRRLVCE
jgi:hypothetical protein